MATHSSIFAWRIPGMAEPGGLQETWVGFDPSVGEVPWRRKWQPTPVCLPGKSDGQRNLALVVFLTFFNFSLNLAIRSSCSEPQSAPGVVFADYIELLHLWPFYAKS